MPENQHIEYKQTWRDEYLKWICGFANAQGGVLEIGRNDRGAVVELADSANLMETLPNKMRDMLGIVADVDLATEGGKEYLRITVEPYPYPISYKGEYHYRSGSTKQMLKGAALDQFLLRKQGRHWDGVPVPHVAPADLDRRALADFRKRAARSRRLPKDTLNETDETLIDKLRLTEGRHLKRAAVLLFHPDPEHYITGAYVKIGHFRTNADLLYHDEIHGDLFAQADKAMDLLLTKYLKAAISYACRATDVPQPEFRHEQTGLWITFTYRPPKPEKKTPVKTPEAILTILTANPHLSLAEVAGKTGKSVSAVERASAKLVNEGRLRYVGPRKGGRWEILE